MSPYCFEVSQNSKNGWVSMFPHTEMTKEGLRWFENYFGEVHPLLFKTPIGEMTPNVVKGEPTACIMG
jgi:hypothetical protein